MHAMSGSHVQVGGLGSASGSQRVAARCLIAVQHNKIPCCPMRRRSCRPGCLMSASRCRRCAASESKHELLRLCCAGCGSANRSAAQVWRLASQRDAAEGRGDHAICQPAPEILQRRSAEQFLHRWVPTADVTRPCVVMPVVSCACLAGTRT